MRDFALREPAAALRGAAGGAGLAGCFRVRFFMEGAELDVGAWLLETAGADGDVKPCGTGAVSK